MENTEINYDDNFLSPNDFKNVVNYCHDASYIYGESDDYGLPPTGMISMIESDEWIFNLFKTKLENKCSFLREMDLYRMYINCFAPNELPYFHIDGKGYTFLYYANENWNMQEGGETQFFLDGNVHGVSPIPNRLVMFNGMLQHRATSFRSQHRFTIAIKYGYDELPTEDDLALLRNK